MFCIEVKRTKRHGKKESNVVKGGNQLALCQKALRLLGVCVHTAHRELNCIGNIQHYVTNKTKFVKKEQILNAFDRWSGFVNVAVVSLLLLLFNFNHLLRVYWILFPLVCCPIDCHVCPLFTVYNKMKKGKKNSTH